MNIKKKILLSIYHPVKPFLSLDAKQEEVVRNFNGSIRRGEIKFEEVNCLCGNDIFYQIADIDRYGLRQSTVICKKCGLILSNPRMTRPCYQEFYESDLYRRLYDGENHLEKCKSLYSDGRVLPIFKSIVKFKPLQKICSLLEFGAGGGWNLVPLIKAGINVKGYDYSKELTALGRKRGINLEQGGVDDIIGKYDVVILNHVIEHFTDFFSDMNKIISHLNDEGIVYIAVPNIMNFSMGQLQNAHTYYFSPRTFRYYLDQCGLKIIHFQNEYGGHMSGIFIKSQPELNENYLRGHLREFYLRMNFIKFKSFASKVLGIRRWRLKKPNFPEQVMRDVLDALSGHCMLCPEKAIDCHHRFENTKWHNKLYPLFTQSPYNLAPLCRDCHDNRKHELDIPESLVKVYEEYLKARGEPNET